MKVKQIPEDFIVDELYDLNELKNKKVEGPKFYYFILKKKDYTVNRAIERVARAFGLGVRDIHFAGTKDRFAITTQLISMKRLKSNWEETLKYFNETNENLNLTFMGNFPARINLGDNLGNKFTITLRDLTNDEVERIKEKINNPEKKILNLFGSQRFGFQRNNITIGKYLLRGNFEKAFFHILTTIPKVSKEEHEVFVNYLKDNWKELIETNNWVHALEIIPLWLHNEREMIQWVSKYKNDFLGAINKIHKKIRTMYVNSYQSYLFNEAVIYLDSRGKLGEQEELPLVSSETKLEGEFGDFIQGLLSRDGLNLSYFEMKRSPTIKPKEVMRKVYLDVSGLNILSIEKDELNSGREKIILSFSLSSGNYATVVIDWLKINK